MDHDPARPWVFRPWLCTSSVAAMRFRLYVVGGTAGAVTALLALGNSPTTAIAVTGAAGLLGVELATRLFGAGPGPSSAAPSV